MLGTSNLLVPIVYQISMRTIPNQLLPRPALPKRTDESLMGGEVQIESNPVTRYGADNENELASVHRTDPYAACSDGEEFDNWADHGCSYAAVSPDN